MRSLFCSILALALAAGCARTSKASQEDSAAAKAATAQEGKGVVYLYRLGRAVGAATATPVKVNGLDAGGLGPGTFFKWDLKPGKYTFYSGTSESSATVALDVEAGNVYYIEQNVRLGLTSGGRVSMRTRDIQTGQGQVESKRLVVSAYVPEP